MNLDWRDTRAMYYVPVYILRDYALCYVVFVIPAMPAELPHSSVDRALP